MRLLRWLAALAQPSGRSYQAVSTEERNADLSLVPLSFRSRISAVLQDGESVTHFEKKFLWFPFLTYFLVGLLPMGVWVLLLSGNARNGIRQPIWGLATGWALVITSFVMSLGSYQFCKVVLIFTTSRALKMFGNGQIEWIQWTHIIIPNTQEIKGNRIPFKVNGDNEDANQNPLQELSFHFVKGIPDLEKLVFCLMTDPQSLDSSYQLSSLKKDYSTLGEKLSTQLSQLLIPDEKVIWCYRPAAWRIALFSISMSVFILGTILAWAPCTLFDNYTVPKMPCLWLSAIALAITLLTVAMEYVSCRVIYTVTDRAISVYYQRSSASLSYPISQLKSVGIWADKWGNGTISFLFRCNNHTKSNLTKERGSSKFCTYHIQPVSEARWHLPIKDAAKVLQEVSENIGSEMHDVEIPEECL